jgi:hypothetical protein
LAEEAVPPSDARAQATDVTSGSATLAAMRPQSYALLLLVTDADLSNAGFRLAFRR